MAVRVALNVPFLGAMGVKRFEDLDVWKLADQVRTLVFTVTRREAFDQDPWLGTQLRRAADSACSSIAEGFGRFGPREFSYFLRIAIGSLEEVKSRCALLVSIDACSVQEAAEIRRLSSRACGAAVNLLKYLRHGSRGAGRGSRSGGARSGGSRSGESELQRREDGEKDGQEEG